MRYGLLEADQRTVHLILRRCGHLREASILLFPSTFLVVIETGRWRARRWRLSARDDGPTRPGRGPGWKVENSALESRVLAKLKYCCLVNKVHNRTLSNTISSMPSIPHSLSSSFGSPLVPTLLKTNLGEAPGTRMLLATRSTSGHGDSGWLKAPPPHAH